MLFCFSFTFLFYCVNFVSIVCVGLGLIVWMFSFLLFVFSVIFLFVSFV